MAGNIVMIGGVVVAIVALAVLSRAYYADRPVRPRPRWRLRIAAAYGAFAGAVSMAWSLFENRPLLASSPWPWLAGISLAALVGAPLGILVGWMRNRMKSH